MDSNIKDASILITGTNGGIGLETVRIFVEAQAKIITLACRTVEKAELVKSQFSGRGDSDTHLEAVGGFDMIRATSIRDAVAKLPKDKAFDIVFLQSGGMVVARDFEFVRVGNQTIETTIYQNVIGGYLTVKYLEERRLLSPTARIVFAGGEGARGIPRMIEKPEYHSAGDFLSYIHEGRNKYSALNAIGVSKFASALLVQKLATLDDGKEYIWFSPGLTARTNGLDQLPNPKRFVIKKIGFPVMNLLGMAQSSKQAAEKYVACLAGKYGNNGDLIGAPEGKAIGKLVDQKPMNTSLTNHMLRDAFWEVTRQVWENLKQ